MKTIYKKLLLLVLLFPFAALAQSTLEGKVVDNVSKQPIPGVNVVVQGAANSTQTDFDGKFRLTKIKKGDKVLVSYIGYNSVTVPYTGQNDITVSLEESSNQLQEVVIQVGYGTAKKKDATGSVSLITAKDFNKGAIVSTDQLLAGKAAGVRITNNGGSPDSAPNIRIRGGASLNANNSPLIIIDGVPLGDLNPAGVSNPFSLINPNDVESFSILKDASATAIYGVRASNGIIIITTKKGTVGAPQYNYSSSISIGKVDRKLEVMNGTDYTRFIQEYHPDYTNLLGIDDPATAAVDNPATPEIEGRILSNTDWQEAVFRTAISSDHNFSARANLYKKIPFRFSLGMTNNQGVIKTSDYKRFSYSFKMTPKLLNDDLKIDLNAKGTYTDINDIDEGGALGGALNMDPTKPIYGNQLNNRFNGYYQEVFFNDGATRDFYSLVGSYNPVALLNQRNRPQRTTRFLGNVEFDYKMPFLRDLRAVLNLGLDASQSRIREVYTNNALATYQIDQNNPDPNTNYVFNPGLNYLENQTSTNQTMDAYLAYTKSLTGVITRVDAQAGYSYQNFVTDGNKDLFSYTADGSGSGIRQPFIENARNPTNRYYLPLNLQAYFARANIDLFNKYLFTATFRADGTSLFLKNKRWGYFPAVGAAWKMKEENFLKNSKLIQDLKLRVSYGKTGQSSITDVVGFFPTRPFFEVGNANGQYLPGLNTYTAQPYDPNITWEKTTTLNLGVDFEFFKNSILAGSFDVYNRKTTDLLSKVPSLPGQSTAATEFISNVGSIDGKGFELNLNVKAIQSEDFNVNLGGNLAYNYNKVSELKGVSVVQDTGSGLNQTGVYLAFNPVGQQPYSAWVFEQIYDATGQPIVGAYVDRNDDGRINNDDRYYVAMRPNWTYGFSTAFNYKNWDLTANFRGQVGGQVYNLKTLTNGNTQGAVGYTGNYLINVLDFYNGAANPLFTNFNGNATFSDYLLEDASFLRCDNLTLGYKFKDNLPFLNKAGIKVYGSVNNLFILTEYSGQDPENFNGIDRNFYPRPRTYTFGVSIDF
ncbi:MAG: SusC/RagA family TonB-linked outer membrane protein [Flavobacterium psychrophilum]